MKKIIFLGAAYSQIPIIIEAKRRGHYIITCDYLPDNPGHRYADEYHNVSTVDLRGVLDLAKRLAPQSVIAYASDIASVTAAYVSERLGLPGNSYHSVLALAEKDRFRALQKKLGLNAPQSVVLTDGQALFEKLRNLAYPFIIKPTDSAGSKGVTKIVREDQVQGAYQYALQYSRNNRIIAEEFIGNEIADLHGDGFVLGGELVFCCLGDHMYAEQINPCNPMGTLWPSRFPDNVTSVFHKEVELIIKESGFSNGPINIEGRINSQGLGYIMEIGPRSGGYFVPQAIQLATGFDMVKATLDLYDHHPVKIPLRSGGFSAYYAIHSISQGTLDSVTISPELAEYLVEKHVFLSRGTVVMPFTSSNAIVGVALLKFPDRKTMNSVMNKIDSYIQVVLQ